MKKTLIASAIAAVGFSSIAMAAESNLPTVYGNIQLAVTHDNIDNGPSSVDMFDNGSTLGVMHEHIIAPGVTGFFKAELEFDADDKADNGGLNAFDEAYIGVKGESFGQVWVGSDDSTYETAVDEISNFFEVASLSMRGPYDTGEGHLVQYKTPSFAGLTLGGAVQVNDDSDAGGKSYPYQLSAVYAVDALELAFAMDSNDGGRKYSSNDLSANNENTYGLRASYDLSNLRLTAQYQTRKDVFDLAGIMGVYTLGANQFALAYEYKTADDSADTKTDTISLQALHNVSDNLYVYVEGYFGGGDDVYGKVEAVDPTFENPAGKPGVAAYSDERTVAAVGATYYF